MSEEEKRTKKQKIEDNRRLRAMSQNSTTLSFTSSSSPSLVPQTECFHFPIGYQKRVVAEDDDSNEDNKHNIHLFDEINDTKDLKPMEQIFNYTNNINQNIFDYRVLLNGDDRTILTKIEEDYTRAVQLNVSVVRGFDIPCLRILNDVTDVVNEPAQMGTIRLITFFKLTPEFNVRFIFFILIKISFMFFQSLHEDDRLALVKHNLLAVLYLHLCMCVDVDTEIYHEPNTANDFCYSTTELRRYSDEVYHQSMILIKEVQDLTSNDHLIIKLSMLIMIFSKGSDLNEPTWLQPQEIFHAQNIFVNLLWKYLNVRFSNDETASIYSRLIFACMKAQKLGRKTKEAVSNQNVSNDHLAPLMQSVLLNS
jgi:hypothetical protein